MKYISKIQYITQSITEDAILTEVKEVLLAAIILPSLKSYFQFFCFLRSKNELYERLVDLKIKKQV